MASRLVPKGKIRDEGVPKMHSQINLGNLNPSHRIILHMRIAVVDLVAP